MLQNHILLGFFWTLYGVFHSVLASGRLKRALFARLPALRPYYRSTYVAFAFLSLVAVLWFQLRLRSPLLLGPLWRIPGGLLAITGTTLMGICIRKYFLSLSGLRSLVQHSEVPNELRIDGVHRYVRHPLYLGTFLAIWGLFGLFPYASLLVMNVVVHGYTLLALRYEEAKLRLEFGAAYEQYARRVPRVWPAPGRRAG
ncbi:methyltransferase family protein [Flaviaesturariibacter aridisoli]|uniref:Isoprenylcysteine carboxylmethyltransferase family protein n=1 Tax=Flaviaesturariibacter aridisoli TaxID=2545761 RepID=A0A4R4E4T7_9BACT|nr:isoprenylcysteine carboxylmethyltransferase family protein [Flaviaesturariibacter aridisoli]TCZ73853.1 isoprenylcysteine carboxylmethyltransferase family protein [Flaviaesturariibacter aridisoli]